MLGRVFAGSGLVQMSPDAFSYGFVSVNPIYTRFWAVAPAKDVDETVIFSCRVFSVPKDHVLFTEADGRTCTYNLAFTKRLLFY